MRNGVTVMEVRYTSHAFLRRIKVKSAMLCLTKISSKRIMRRTKEVPCATSIATLPLCIPSQKLVVEYCLMEWTTRQMILSSSTQIATSITLLSSQVISPPIQPLSATLLNRMENHTTLPKERKLNSLQGKT